MDYFPFRLRVIRKLLLAFALSGCLSGSFEREAYAASSDDELLVGILVNLVAPTDRSIYGSDAEELASQGIDWEDVANFSTSCQLAELSRNASRQNLEIIHFLWIKNKGNEDVAAKSIKSTLGVKSYREAVETFAGGAFDCQLETLRFIDGLKSS